MMPYINDIFKNRQQFPSLSVSFHLFIPLQLMSSDRGLRGHGYTTLYFAQCAVRAALEDSITLLD
jgi:hypothetical protein